MNATLELFRGLHPGVVLERELNKRKLLKGKFALAIHEYPQTLSAIISGKRNMNTPLALRIEKELGIEEGFFMTLQVFFEIKEEKKKLTAINKPDMSRFRPALFWDTRMENIDWIKQKEAVIKRVFERGNDKEKKELLRFYGEDEVHSLLNIS